LERRCLVFSCVWLQLVAVSPKCKMTFPHVSSIVLSLDLATNNVAEVVLSELTFTATLVINWGATKVIVWYSISHDSVLLV